MAKGRRPPDIRNTLGSFVQSALEQVGVVRDVVERGAAAQRERHESVKLDRRRSDALAELGEAVYRLAVQGRLGALQDDPTLRPLLSEIDDLDQRIEAGGGEQDESGFSARSGFPAPRREAVASGAVPGRPAGRSEPEGDVRVWRPVPPFAADAASERDATEVTAESPEVRVWRPSLDDVEADEPAEVTDDASVTGGREGAEPEARDPGGTPSAPDPEVAPSATAPAVDPVTPRGAGPAAAPSAPESRAASAPLRGAAGTTATERETAAATARTLVESAIPPVAGISFDNDWDDEWRDEYDDRDDGDLEEYMHDDDVPERPDAEPGAHAETGSTEAAATDAAPRRQRRRRPPRSD